jgi:riboflavin synthase
MFTGIIEHLGVVDSLKLHAEGGRLTIHAPTVAPRLAIANSIAVDGCCLTVVALENERFSADLSAETIRKTSMGE